MESAWAPRPVEARARRGRRPVTVSQANRAISRAMPFVVPSAMALGILLPGIVGRLVPAVPAVFFVVVFAGSAALRLTSIRDVLRRPAPLLAILAILHTVMPVLAWAVARVGFAAYPDIAEGVILEFLAPTASAGFAWISICGGSTPLGLVAVFADTVLSPVFIPLGVRVFIGSNVAISTSSLAWDMAVMILIPGVLAVLVNEASGGRCGRRAGPWLEIVVKLGILLVILASATRIAPLVRTLNPLLAVVTAVMFLVSAAGYLLGWAAGRAMRRDRGDVVAMIYGSGMRNINAGAVIAVSYFPAATVFPVIVSTLFQQVTAALVAAVIRRRLPREGGGLGMRL